MSARKRPAALTDHQPSSQHRANGYAESTALPGHDRVEPLDAEDRDDLAVLEAAAAHGYRLATKCTVCGHWLTSRKSVLAHLGPKCRARAEAK